MSGGPALDQPTVDAATAPEPPCDQSTVDAATAPELVGAGPLEVLPAGRVCVCGSGLSAAGAPGASAAEVLLCADPALDDSPGPFGPDACSPLTPPTAGLGERRGRSLPDGLPSELAPESVTGDCVGRAPTDGPLAEPLSPAGRLPAGWFVEGGGIVGRAAGAGTTGVLDRLAPPTPGMTGGAMLDGATAAGALGADRVTWPAARSVEVGASPSDCPSDGLVADAPASPFAASA